MAEVFPDEGLAWLLSVVPGGASPATLHLGLFTSQTGSTVPAATAVLSTGVGVTEVAGDNYTRPEVPAAGWSTPMAVTGGLEVVAAKVTFPTVGTGGWGEINGFFLATAPTGGVAIFYANFDTEEPIEANQDDTVRVVPALRMLN